MGVPLIPSLLTDAGGESFLRVFVGDDPAAGAEVAETVPGGVNWTLHAVSVTLVTDGTAANRTPRLLVDDGTTEFFRGGSATVIAASTTVRLCGFSGAGIDANPAGTLLFGLPAAGIPLLPGFRVRTLTANVQAGDNYGPPALLVSEAPLRGESAELIMRMDRLVERLEYIAPLLEGR